MKSRFQSYPRFDVVNSLLEKITQLNAAPGNEIEHTFMFEYISHQTVLSRPKDATAHLRSHRSTTVCALKWANNSPSVERAAKQAALELTDIVAKAEAQVSGTESNTGYGNSSERASVTPGHV